MGSLLERMRQNQEARKPKFEKDLSVFPFWNMKYGKASLVRFLPYEDEITGAFWAEKIMLPMQFTDSKDDSKIVTYRAPCREMYDPGDRCPMLVPVRELYAEAKKLKNAGQKDEAERLEKVAGYHWKKPTYYYQGFVIKAGMEEDEKDIPENPIRVFPITKKLHQLIYNSVFDNEVDPFEKLPTGEFDMDDIDAIIADTAEEAVLDRLEGYNFIIKKGKQGNYAEWVSGSGWATNSAVSLDDEQVVALYEHRMHDLSKRLPDRPTPEQYEVLAEMMDLSTKRMLDDEEAVWNPEWEELGFKPWRPKDKNSDDDSSGDNSGSKRTASSGGSRGNASSAIDKARRSRGAAATEAKKSEPEAEPKAVVEASSDDASSDDNGGSDQIPLSERIRQRVSKNAESAA